MYTHVHTCTHMYTHVHTTHMYTHVHTCTHMYTHVHTCTRMYTHVHTVAANVNMYNPNVGAAVCAPCPAGNDCISVGLSELSSGCTAGFYSGVGFELYDCFACPAGTFNSRANAGNETSCEPCPFAQQGDSVSKDVLASSEVVFVLLAIFL